MNNEQIIIDGVDVSGCEHIDFDCANCEIFANMCHENPNCNYKQLKRKEQECEELKVENNAYKTSIIANLDRNISKRYEELLEENDQLKETIEGLLSIQYTLADNIKQLRQTLAEIKEIIKFNKTNRLDGGCHISIEQILQKISEVEDDN